MLKNGLKIYLMNNMTLIFGMLLDSDNIQLKHENSFTLVANRGSMLKNIAKMISK